MAAAARAMAVDEGEAQEALSAVKQLVVAGKEEEGEESVHQ